MGETPRFRRLAIRWSAMRELRRSAHTVYSLHYHFVFTTKYRKPVLVGEIGHTVWDLIREICRSEDIEILEGHVRPDHVHPVAERPTPSRAEPCHAGD
jgi:putative transposase